MRRPLRDSPPPITRSDLPGELKSLIQQCLAKDSADRIQSARLLAKGLQKARLQQPSSSVEATRRVDTTSDDGFWVAVAPFKFTGANPELTALSRFSYLHVLTQASSTRQARYVMEGSLRQAGSTLRLAVQLVDKTTGTHIWAETYNRPFQSDDSFTVQDELVLRIVSTVADQHGLLPHSIASAIRGKSSDPRPSHSAASNSIFEELQTRSASRMYSKEACGAWKPDSALLGS